MLSMTGPTRPRWTHVALPAGDIDASVDWYTRFTPLIVVERFADEHGRSAWLANPDEAEHPFVLVLVDFAARHGSPQPQLAPFAHLGVELPERGDVDEIAVRGRDAGCLAGEPMELPPPVGYICSLRDPDGNVVEFSHGQQVHELVRLRAAQDAGSGPASSN
jgi:catechol 2,3-dioxygenase-like lactoylglutathione lyase family enzyme